MRMELELEVHADGFWIITRDKRECFRPGTEYWGRSMEFMRIAIDAGFLFETAAAHDEAMDDELKRLIGDDGD